MIEFYLKRYLKKQKKIVKILPFEIPKVSNGRTLFLFEDEDQALKKMLIAGLEGFPLPLFLQNFEHKKLLLLEQILTHSEKLLDSNLLRFFGHKTCSFSLEDEVDILLISRNSSFNSFLTRVDARRLLREQPLHFKFVDNFSFSEERYVQPRKHHTFETEPLPWELLKLYLEKGWKNFVIKEDNYILEDLWRNRFSIESFVLKESS